ncbi:MAG: iron-containing alcohol dehydrogenase [Candidatus Polarisedimenticolia bacterium]
MMPLHDAASAALSAWSARIGGTRLIFGPGSLDGLGEAARESSGHRVLLVTDPGLEKAGHASRAEASLRRAGLEVLVFDGVEENPSTRHVEAGAAAARPAGIDLIVALGGGSAMDCAKGINFLLTNGGSMESYWGFGHAARPMLASIGVPTTAGTGSDAQSYALIEQEGTRRKMACGDEKARFATVILDPDLTGTCPRRVSAASGMDAVSHAVESWVSRPRNPVSCMLGLKAWRLLEEAFAPALDDPGDLRARGAMLLGAHLAGAAVESSMLGAAHASANPLTSRDHALAHGEAVLLMLPHVVRFNGPAAGPLYGELLGGPAAGEAGAPEALASRLEAMRAHGGLPARLRDVGVERAELPGLAEAAGSQWTAQFNPRQVTRDDFEALYDAAW